MREAPDRRPAWNALSGGYSTLKLAVQPLSLSPTMMLGRKICTGSRAEVRLTICSASNLERS